MKRYKIADLTVDIDAKCERLEQLGKPYETNKIGNADIIIKLTDEEIKKLSVQHPNLTADEIAYLATGTLFYRKSAVFECILVHSSCIMYQNKAYLFTADSGTGKSTHTGLWKKVFGDEITYLNDDKPILRKQNGIWNAFGTPWSGKTDLNSNLSAPVQAIVFLKRGKENSVRKIEIEKEPVAPMFIKQTSKPKKLENMEALLKNADDVLKSVNLYEMFCNISEDAVWTAYKEIVKD